MAVTITSKKGYSGGSSHPNRAVLHITGEQAAAYPLTQFDTDLGFVAADGTTQLTFRPSRIEQVLVLSPGNDGTNALFGGVNINGITYANGHHDLSEIGGVPLPAATANTDLLDGITSDLGAAITGSLNVIVVLRA